MRENLGNAWHLAESSANVGAADERLRQLKVSTSIDTFAVAKHVDFIVFQRVGWNVRFIGSSGDLINLGAGSWIYAGTATDAKGGSAPWNFEYQITDDSLIIQIIDRSAKFTTVSDPQSAVQFRKDVSGMPTLILVRREILIDWHDDDYGFRARAGSFIQFS